jgi:hypothetical protein
MTYPTRWQVPAGYSTSNDPDVFPVLAGQEFVSKKSPKFPATIKKTSASGREVRYQVASQPTWDFKVSYEFLTNNSPTVSDLQNLFSFFLSRNGQAQPFFFYDPYDNAVSNQYIGTGNGSTISFQLCRTINPAGANGFVENVYAVLGAPTVLVGGTPLYGPAQQNVLAYSQTFANSVWGKNNCTATDNATVAPDGTTSAASIARTTTGNDYIFQTIANNLAGQTVTFSVWLKIGSITGSCVLRIRSADGLTEFGTATVTPTGTWTRFSATVTVPNAAPTGLQVIIDPSSDTGSAGDNFYCWGAQLETGSVPTTLNATHALTGDFTIGANGLITFNTAPANTLPIYWSGQFLYLCRFAQDNLDAEQMTLNLWSNKGLEFGSFHS